MTDPTLTDVVWGLTRGRCNLVTGGSDANIDRAPVVALAGQADTRRMHKESHQHLDLVQLFQPISKYSVKIRQPDNIPEVVRKAFKVAETEKPGFAFLELPEDIAEAPVNAERSRGGQITRRRPAHRELRPGTAACRTSGPRPAYHPGANRS